MGILEDSEQKAKTWLIEKELPIALRAGTAALIGFLASGKSVAVLNTMGITIDPGKLTATIVKVGTVAAVAFLAHLSGGFVAHKAYGPKDVVTPQGGQHTPLPTPSLDLLADKPSPLAPKDTDMPLK